jgi:quinol monooxygenase YgiN
MSTDGRITVAVLRLTRFKTDPADAEEMLARRGALIDAVRRAYPGLLQAQLARTDDQTWVDAWRWDSRAHAESAIANVSTIPEAAAAFSLTRDSTAEFADLVDER